MNRFRAKIKPLADGFSMLILSDRLALCYKALKKPGKEGRMDRLQCGYIGFESEQDARMFVARLKHKLTPFAPLIKIRESDRLPEYAWEIKISEFDGLLNLILCLRAKELEVEQHEQAAA